MRKQRHYRLPEQWKLVFEVDKNRNASIPVDKKKNFSSAAKRKPVKQVIYKPTRKTLAKQKEKITLPKINIPT